MNSLTSTHYKTHYKTRYEIAWHALRDNPDLNSYQLHELIPDMPFGSVSSVLSMMDQRGMVKVTGRRDGCRTYSVTTPEFVWLPFPPSQEPSGPIETVTTAPIVQATPVEPPQPEVSAAKPIDVGALPLSEAYALYTRLKEIFK